MKKLWFKARRYGWGWTPVSIEGWIVVIGSVLLIFAGAAAFVHRISHGADPRLAIILFMAWNVLVVGCVVAICRMTGETPRWRWGP